MGQATCYCEKCGEMIPATDFDKGKAVHYQSKDYCAACKGEIAHLLPQAPPEGSDRKRSSGLLPSAKRSSGALPSVKRSSGILPSVGAPRPGSGLQKAVSAPARGSSGAMPAVGSAAAGGKGDTKVRLKEAVEAASGEGMAPTTKLALIGGGALVLIGLVVWVLMEMSAKAEAERKAKFEADAETALREVKDYAGRAPEEFDRIMEMLEQAKRKTQDSKSWPATKDLEAKIQRDKEVFLTKAERRKRLADIQDRGTRSPLDIPALLRQDIPKLISESELMGPEFPPKIAEAKAYLHKAYVSKVVEQVEAQVAKLDTLDSIDPLRAMYDEALRVCEGIEESQQLKVQLKIKDLQEQWNVVAQRAYQTTEADVESLLGTQKFDEAMAKIDEYPKKFAGTQYYGNLIKLRNRVVTEKARAAAVPAQAPGGGGGTKSPDPGPILPGGVDESEIAGSVVNLQKGDKLDPGWQQLVNGPMPAFQWDVPEPGVLHGNNTADRPGAICKGSPRWQEYVFEFDARCAKGDFVVGVLLNPAEKVIPFYDQQAAVPRDEWHHWKITVTQTEVICERPDRQAGKFDALDKSKQGMVGFALMPGAELYVRNMTVKVVKVKDK